MTASGETAVYRLFLIGYARAYRLQQTINEQRVKAMRSTPSCSRKLANGTGSNQ